MAQLKTGTTIAGSVAYHAGNHSSTGSSHGVATGSVNGFMSSSDYTKLSGIATGANLYVHPNHTGDVTSTADGATVIGANKVTLSMMATMATASFLGRNTASTGNVEVLSTATVKTMLGLALTQTALATGFSLAGGTTSKSLTVSNTLTLAGTDAATLNIGAGGTLGTAAFTASTAYATAAQGTLAGTALQPSLVTAANDFLIGTGSGVVSKKTLAETKTILGLALTQTANATGFSIAGGTTSKTLTVSNTMTLAGTDASTLNIGSGGTLASGAFAAAYTHPTTSGNKHVPAGGSTGQFLGWSADGTAAWGSVDIPDGVVATYSATRQYHKGEFVVYDSSIWYCTNTPPSPGYAPPNQPTEFNGYWGFPHMSAPTTEGEVGDVLTKTGAAWYSYGWQAPAAPPAPAWGQITGTLADQTDLSAAFDELYEEIGIMSSDLNIMGSSDAWGSEDTYVAGAEVIYHGMRWISLVDNNMGNMPFLTGGKWRTIHPYPWENAAAAGQVLVSGTPSSGVSYWEDKGTKTGSETFTSGTTRTVYDDWITASTYVMITPVGTPAGTWSVESAAGSFTITSTSAETNCAFDWGALK